MNETDISRMLEQEAERFEREKDKSASRTYVTPRPAIEPSQVYSVRLPVSRLEELRTLAAREGKQPSSMIRDWILQRLEVELSQETKPNPGLVNSIRGYVATSQSRDMSRPARIAYERTIRSEIKRMRSRTYTISARTHKRGLTARQPSSTSAQG